MSIKTIEVPTEISDPETVIGFIYDMCIQKPFQEGLIHPQVNEYILELNDDMAGSDILGDGIKINLDPQFFKNNQKLSQEILPQLAYNIQNYSKKNVQITCGDYRLLLDGLNTIACGRVAYGKNESTEFIKTFDNSYKAATGFIKVASGPSLSRFIERCEYRFH